MFLLFDGNGGIGVMLAFALSKLVMLAGMVALMPPGVLHLETVVETAKRIAAGVMTSYC